MNKFFNDFGKNIASGMNVCKLAKVNEFDPTTMTISATPMPSENSAMILNIPVVCFNTKDYFIYNPLSVGDVVVLVFMDNDSDSILMGEDNVATERSHDYSDCVCIGGISLLNETLDNSNPNSLVIKKKGSKGQIRLNKDGSVDIETPVLKYNGREVACKGDSTSDGAVIV